MSNDLSRLWNLSTPAQRKAVAFGGVAVAGYAMGSKLAMALGTGGLITTLVEIWADAQLAKHPAEMNGFFQTSGALSAVRGEGDAIALRRLRKGG